MRKGPLNFETDLVASARGVPWNASLDVIPVKKKRSSKHRAPVLVQLEEAPAEEAGGNPGPDEAGSDPSSSSSSSISLPGESEEGHVPTPMSGASSAELIPDVNMGQQSGVHQVVSGAAVSCDMFARIIQEGHATGDEQQEIPTIDVDLSEFENGGHREEKGEVDAV